MFDTNTTRQDEFGEAWFPTLTVSSDLVDFSMSAKMNIVYHSFSITDSAGIKKDDKTPTQIVAYNNEKEISDTVDITQTYNIPLRSDYIDTCEYRSKEAVTALLNVASTLGSYVDSRDMVGEGPDVLGIGRYFVRPTFFAESLDIIQIVDSTKTSDRIADMQATLVNKIRDYAFRMYRDSGFKAAYDALSGGISPVPTVVIGTDPVLARYLTITGELRTLGSEFDVRLVSTLDNRVSGKIFISFGIFNEERNTTPHPLNFGNMVLVQNSTYPRFSFVNHCPVLTVLQIRETS
jgi:hypothetical protein